MVFCVRFKKKVWIYFLLILVLAVYNFSSLGVVKQKSASAENKNEVLNQNPALSFSGSKNSILAIDPEEKPTPEEEFSQKLDKSGRFFGERLIVKFKDNVSDEVKRQIARKHKAKFVREDLNLLGAKVLWVNQDNWDSVYQALKEDPNVEYVEKEGVVTIQADFPASSSASFSFLPPDDCYPNDPLYCNGSLWGLNTIWAPSGWRLPPGKGSANVTVAVLDTGVDYNHYDLRDRVIKGYNYTVTPSDYINYTNPMDNLGHGTFIAGIIGAATNNASYMAGIDWNAKILAMKVINDSGIGQPEHIAAAINDAADESSILNIKVINISHATSEDHITIRNAIEYAQSKGITVVASAAHPADASTDCFIGFPAAYPYVVSVVAVDQNLNHVSGCTERLTRANQNIQISAPGKDLYSLNILKNGGGTAFFAPGNTSFAAPFVSGVASVLSSCSSTPRTDLLLGTIDIGPPGWDVTFGYGLVNLWKALTKNCFPAGGDVDCNGRIEAVDALYILRYVAGLQQGYNDHCPLFLPQADVDRDGDIDAIDALYVLQYLAGVRNIITLSLIPPANDSDSDGMTDSQEAQYSCLNPNLADANVDYDGDSVLAPNLSVNMNNIAELAWGTNPCLSDTDGDGYKDGAEVFIGTDPKIRCGVDAWPADFDNNKKIDISDLASFLAPVYRLHTSYQDSKYSRRWDIVPNGKIDISDLASVITVAPPMFNGARAYGGGSCIP